MRFGYDAKRAFHNNSGLGNYSRDIIRIMSRQFPENEYILYNPKPPKAGRIIEGRNIQIVYPASAFWKLSPALWRQIGIAGLLKKNSVDLYHGLSGEITRGIDRKETKVIVTIHDLIPERFPELYNPVDRRIYRSKMKYAVDHADIVIAISEQTKADIVRYLNADPSKIRVHYQGCHAAFKNIYPEEQIAHVKQKYSLPENFILNVGTLEKRKNILSLLEAVKDLEYHLVLVGKETKYTHVLKKFILVNGMQDRVRFLRGIAMNDLAILYQAATLFCYPSIFEGFGIPVIEALYSKTAVITSSGSCFAEAGGPHSIYVQPGDVNELRKSIEHLMESGKKREEMEQAGFEFVQKFNDENVGNELMKIYRELIHA